MKNLMNREEISLEETFMRDMGVVSIWLDRDIGRIEVEHTGNITWNSLQIIKNEIWGASTVAIEIYPPQSSVIDTGHYRHLWRLGKDDWWPNMTDTGAQLGRIDTIKDRFRRLAY